MKHFFKRKSIAASVAVLIALVAAFFAVVFAVSVPVLHEASSQNMPLRALVSAAPVTRVVPIAATTVSAEDAATQPYSKSLSASQDTFHIPLKDSVVWLEMEKNTDYTICVDGADKGLWKVKDFSYEKVGDCIRLNSGNYVKNGKIQYVTQIGHVVTFNLLVGMKYIDLSTESHWLGYEKSNELTFVGKNISADTKIVYKDPTRLEEINEVLVVDEYKVTECEFVQMLWDSIPAQKNDDLYDSQNFWIEKKKSMAKNGYCDAHDSAAARVFLHHALIYANNRSLRDGFKPVYSFEKATEMGTSFESYKDGSFNIGNASFFPSFSDNGENRVRVKVNDNADGYRLPYYDEWTALARGGKAFRNYSNFWGGKKDSAEATKYAWFGVIDPDDRYAKMSKDDFIEKGWLEMSCGEWMQNSRPVGMLKPNAYGLYDVLGLVCENTLMPRKSRFGGEVFSCKGGFLTTPLKELNFGNHCDNCFYRSFQGLRLVRQIK